MGFAVPIWNREPIMEAAVSGLSDFIIEWRERQIDDRRDMHSSPDRIQRDIRW